MKIVILDGYAANPGDMSWQALGDLGELTVYDRTAPEEILKRAGGAEMLIINKTPLYRETIEKLPQLRYIGTISTGYNVVDIEAARERNIPVCNVPSYCTSMVAQHTFALLFELTNHIHEHAASVKSGEWAACEDFCYWKTAPIELWNKTIGIVGFGSIGRAVAQMALALEMKVLVNSRTRRELPEGAQWAELDMLFRQSDVITLHCPLTSETAGLINQKAISLMKKTAIVLNTARGAMINEQDLADALNAGRILGAGMDVLSTEPPRKDNPLLTAKNCVITPHIAWAAKTSRERLINTVVENVAAFLKGKPQNVVN